MALGSTSLKPFVWLRYVDDTFILWPHQEDVQILLDHVNSIRASIQFTMEKEQDKQFTLPRCISNTHRARIQVIRVSKAHFHWAVPEFQLYLLYFDLRPGPKMLFQGDTPEGRDTFQWPVIERDRVGGLRLMIWDKVKVPLCHYSDAPEKSDLWTAWQLFPLDDD